MKNITLAIVAILALTSCGKKHYILSKTHTIVHPVLDFPTSDTTYGITIGGDSTMNVVNSRTDTSYTYTRYDNAYFLSSGY